MATFETCLDCTRKHISAARVFQSETPHGYPIHRWHAAGELYHAEIESGDLYPELARMIRVERLKIMKSHDNSRKAKFTKLLVVASILAGEDDFIRHADINNSKRYKCVEKILAIYECHRLGLEHPKYFSRKLTRQLMEKLDVMWAEKSWDYRSNIVLVPDASITVTEDAIHTSR